MLDGGGDIGLNALGRRLLDVFHVLEVVAALRHPGGATEVVERNGRDPTLGEAQCQFLVEPVEAAHVRQDHDAYVHRLLRGRREGGEGISVARREREVLVRDGGAADHRDGRNGIEFEAHCRPSLTQKSPRKDTSEPQLQVGLAALTCEAPGRSLTP